MVKQDNEFKRISPNVVAIIGTILTLIGGFFLSYNYVQKKKVVAFDYMSNIFYEEEHKNQNSNAEDNTNITAEETKNEESVEEEQSQKAAYDYIGYLKIPKINLTKGFVDINSKDNDVEKNIFLVAGSSYPDVDKGNLIIAGHSGTGWKAFFNNLNKLSTGDVATVTYNGKLYTYKITSIYKQKKKGTIAIYRNYNKTSLTLVTCTNNDSESQTVYIAELQSVENE